MENTFPVDDYVVIVYTPFVALRIEVALMAIPLKYLPEPPDAVRLRLVISRKEAEELAGLAARTNLSLASYCRGLCLTALAGRVDTDDVIAAVKPFRIAQAAKVAEPPKRPRGRPRKTSS